MSRVPLAVLASGSGTNLQSILDACAAPDHPGRVAMVLCNRSDAFALERARTAGIEAVLLRHRDFPSREAFEHAMVERLRTAEVEWIVLAGFMRLLSPVFLEAFPDRVLNIHPALLPAFPGLDGTHQASQYGVRIAGATVHLVDAGTDTGPIVAQAALPVPAGQPADVLAKRVLTLEHRLLPAVVRWACEGRIRREGRQVFVDLPAGEHPWIWDDPEI